MNWGNVRLKGVRLADGGVAYDGYRGLKYLFVTADEFPPFRVDVRVLFVEELAERGHEIHWVMAPDGPRRRSGIEPLGKGLAWVGAAVAGDSRVAKAVRQLQIFLHDWRAIALLLRNRYDFVQVKDKFIAGAILLLAAKLTRTRFVYWLTYPFPEAWLEDSRTRFAQHPLVARLRGYIARLLLYGLILPRADLVFVQSVRMKDDLASKGVPPALMVPVPMGVSAGLLQSIGGRTAKSIVSPSVLYLGSMYRVRHLEMIVRAFQQVVAAVPSASLYFVGGENQEFGLSIDLVTRRVVNGMAHLGVESPAGVEGKSAVGNVSDQRMTKLHPTCLGNRKEVAQAVDGTTAFGEFRVREHGRRVFQLKTRPQHRQPAEQIAVGRGQSVDPAPINPSTDCGRASTSLPRLRACRSSIRKRGLPPARKASALTSWMGRGFDSVAAMINDSAASLDRAAPDRYGWEGAHPAPGNPPQ